VLVAGSYSQQFSRADSIFLNGFQPRFNAPDTGDGYSCSVGGKIINAGEPYALRVCDSFPATAGFSQVYTPLGAGIREQDFNRHRDSINASVQFENASRSLTVTAEYIQSLFKERWTERTIESDNWFSDAGKIFPAGYLNQLGFPNDPNANFTYDKNGVFTSGTLVHEGYYPYGCTPLADASCNYTQLVPGGIATKLSNRSAYNKIKTQDASLKLNWSPVEQLHVSLDGQYVKSNVENSDDAINMNTFTDVSIDLRGKYPAIGFLTPGFNTQDYLANGQGIYYRSAVENRAISDGEEYTFRGDLTYDVSEDSFLRTVRVGGRYSDRKQTVRTNAFNNWGQLSDTYTTGGPNFITNNPELVGNYTYPGFFQGDVAQPIGAPFISKSILENHAALMSLARTVQTGGGTFTPIEDRGGDLIKGYFLPSEVYPNSETTWAAYAMANFGTSLGGDLKLSGNIGIRYVRTIDKSTGSINFATPNQVLPSNYNGSFAAYCAAATSDPANPPPALCKPGVTAAQQQAALAFANGGSLANTANNKFAHWLPSFNARLDVSPKVLFRFAASKAISRPDFDQLRNYVGVSYNSVLGGFQAQSLNPYLKPVEAWQFDLTAEWYFAPVGSLTAALFYKDLKNIVVSNQLYSRDLTNNGATLPVGITGPANSTGHSKIKGAEFAYQQTFDFLPGVLAGLGTQLSYTFIDTGKIVIGPPGYAPSNNLTETGNQPTIDIAGLYEGLPLEGLSKHNANAALFYERGGFQARIAYSWRSRFLLTRLDCCFPFGPVWNEASGQADASVSYSPTRNIKFVFDVQNLLDSTTRTSYAFQDGLRTPRSWFKSDRQYGFSTRLTF
jgi:TonB-dependent receptor